MTPTAINHKGAVSDGWYPRLWRANRLVLWLLPLLSADGCVLTAFRLVLLPGRG